MGAIGSASALPNDGLHIGRLLDVQHAIRVGTGGASGTRRGINERPLTRRARKRKHIPPRSAIFREIVVREGFPSTSKIFRARAVFATLRLENASVL